MGRGVTLVGLLMVAACGEELPGDASIVNGGTTGGFRVLAGGEVIGWLDSASTYTVRVWDPGLGLIFGVNLDTGYLLPIVQYSMESGNCSGTRYIEAIDIDCVAADKGAGPPLYRYAFAELYTDIANEAFGWSKGSRVLVTTDAHWINQRSHYYLQCYGPYAVDSNCVYDYEESDEIPLAFPVPITIEAP